MGLQFMLALPATATPSRIGCASQPTYQGFYIGAQVGLTGCSTTRATSWTPAGPWRRSAMTSSASASR